MISESKLNKALQAIQDLIIEGRRLAYEGTPGKELADFLDGLEYLPGLIVEAEDRTEMFELYLNEICKRKNCQGVINRYNAR